MEDMKITSDREFEVILKKFGTVPIDKKVRARKTGYGKIICFFFGEWRTTPESDIEFC